MSRLPGPLVDRLLSIIISNGNKTEWSPIRSVIIRVITKSDDRAVGVRFVHHERKTNLTSYSVKNKTMSVKRTTAPN